MTPLDPSVYRTSIHKLRCQSHCSSASSGSNLLIWWGSEIRRYCSVGPADTGEGTENSCQKLCPVNAGLAARLRFEIIGGRILWEREMGPFVDGRIRKSTKREKVSQQDLCSHLNVVGLDRFFSRKILVSIAYLQTKGQTLPNEGRF